MPLELRSETSRINGAKGDNVLNENQIFQNEPKPPDLSPLNTTKPGSEICTEPGNANLLIGGVSPNCNAHETITMVY